MMPWQKWSASDEVVVTDACLQGCGAWLHSQQEYFLPQFPESVASRSLNINTLELLAVIVAAKAWGKLWCGLRIVSQCDNETSVTVLNTGRTHNSFLQGCLRELKLMAARCEFEIRVVHIKWWTIVFLMLLSWGCWWLGTHDWGLAQYEVLSWGC